MPVSTMWYDDIHDACAKLREEEDGGSTAAVTGSRSTTSNSNKEPDHSGSGDAIADAQKDSVSRYGKPMQTRTESPKLEDGGDPYSAIKAFLGPFYTRGLQKIVESEEESGEDAAFSTFWTHYDKAGKNYDKRRSDVRQEMANTALSKVLADSGDKGLPPNVTVTTVKDEAVIRHKFNPNKAKGSVDDSEERERDFQRAADAARPQSVQHRYQPAIPKEAKSSTDSNSVQKKADSEHRKYVNNLKCALEDGKISQKEYDDAYRRAVYTHAHGIGTKHGRPLTLGQMQAASDAEVMKIPIIVGGPKDRVPSGASRSRPRYAIGTPLKPVYIRRDEEMSESELPSNVRITNVNESLFEHLLMEYPDVAKNLIMEIREGYISEEEMHELVRQFLAKHPRIGKAARRLAVGVAIAGSALPGKAHADTNATSPVTPDTLHSIAWQSPGAKSYNYKEVAGHEGDSIVQAERGKGNNVIHRRDIHYRNSGRNDIGYKGMATGNRLVYGKKFLKDPVAYDSAMDNAKIDRSLEKHAGNPDIETSFTNANREYHRWHADEGLPSNVRVTVVDEGNADRRERNARLAQERKNDNETMRRKEAGSKYPDLNRDPDTGEIYSDLPFGEVPRTDPRSNKRLYRGVDYHIKNALMGRNRKTCKKIDSIDPKESAEDAELARKSLSKLEYQQQRSANRYVQTYNSGKANPHRYPPQSPRADDRIAFHMGFI